MVLSDVCFLVVLLVLRLYLTKDAQFYIQNSLEFFSLGDYVSSLIYSKVHLFLFSVLEFFLFKLILFFNT